MNETEHQNHIEEIEHTADWALRVRGTDLEALFRNAAEGMLQLMQGKATSSISDFQRIALDAQDVESLLVSWLEELLFIMETQQVILCDVTFLAIDQKRLVADVSFAPVVALHKEIKAVTYNELAVIHNNDEYSAVIVFDV